MTERDGASLLTGLLLLLHTFGAWANVEVNMEDRVEVLRGDTAQIACMFQSSEGTGGTIIQWFYEMPSRGRQMMYYHDATTQYAEPGTPFSDRISVNVSASPGVAMLTINEVRLEDELEYICFIKALASQGQGRTRLKVFDTPDSPTIEGVQAGISIREKGLSKIGTCEVKNGFPKPKIAWYKNNTPLRDSPNEVHISFASTTESSGLLSVSSELTMNVTKADIDNYFYCEVTYSVPGAIKMMETKRINITVLYPSTAVRVWVESPKGKIKEGDSVELHCQGNGNIDSEITIAHEKTKSTWESRMVVLTNVTRQNSGVYECTSMDLENFDSVTNNTAVFVNYLDEVVVKPQDGVVVSQGGRIEASCNAVSSLKTHTAWFKNKKQISQGNVLVLKDATFDTAGTYVCVVTVPEIEGMKKNGTLRVHVQGPPAIEKPKVTEMEKSLEETVDLTCNVRGFPAPKVMWTTSNGEVLETVTQKETDEGVQSEVSFKVTSDIKAFCNASNDFGTDAVAFIIKAPTHISTAATTATMFSTTATHISTAATTATMFSTTETPDPSKRRQKEGRGVIIAVIIICILLLAILGSVLYFLYKKGKICGRSGKQDLTKEKSNKDNTVVEMKSDTEEAELLGVNGEKQPPSD